MRNIDPLTLHGAAGVVPVGDKTANALREKLIPAIEGPRVGVSTGAEAHSGLVALPCSDTWILLGADA